MNEPITNEEIAELRHFTQKYRELFYDYNKQPDKMSGKLNKAIDRLDELEVEHHWYQFGSSSLLERQGMELCVDRHYQVVGCYSGDGKVSVFTAIYAGHEYWLIRGNKAKFDWHQEQYGISHIRAEMKDMPKAMELDGEPDETY